MLSFILLFMTTCNNTEKELNAGDDLEHTISSMNTASGDFTHNGVGYSQQGNYWIQTFIKK